MLATLQACDQEVKSRVRKIVRVQHIVSYIEEKLSEGGAAGEESDTSCRSSSSSLSLLHYVRSSRYDVPSNVKAAVVFDVLKGTVFEKKFQTFLILCNY